MKINSLLNRVLEGVALCLCWYGISYGQETDANKWQVNLGIQSDLHYSTSPEHTANHYHGVNYLTTQIHNKYIRLGVRLEEMVRPLPGFETNKGWGIPYVALTGQYKSWEATLGDVYDQFGSGLVLRSYEDRSLGLDNSIRGGRLAYNFRDLLSIKLVAGQHRNHFDRGWKVWNPDRGALGGGDMELNVGDLLGTTDHGVLLRFGGSYVAKYERKEEITQIRDGQTMALVLPETVGAWASRMAVAYKDLNIYMEYAAKGADPSRGNNYIFRRGSVAMLTASYIWGKNSLFIGARRSENFDFRSDRGASQNDMRINFLQPFTKQQTYSLAALYPYATQPKGEWSFQGQFATKLEKGSWLGGRYGTDIKLTASVVRDIQRVWEQPEWESNPQDPSIMGSDGYSSSFFGMGGPLYHSIDLDIKKKVSPTYTFSLGYSNQLYNQQAIEGHAINGDLVSSNIFIYEGKNKLSSKVTLRSELQYLMSKQAQGDWVFGLVECSILPHIMVTLSDQWNIGTTKEHFYMGSIAGSFGAHRLQLSYGKTREGINCSGGVCRLMPATQGVYLSYNFDI